MKRKWWNSTGLFVVGLVIMWGLSWSFIKIGLEYTPPLLFVGMRTFLGALILVIVAVFSGMRPGLRKHWPTYMISGLFNVVLFFGLQTEGLEYLPSGLLSVLVYLQPIVVGLLAWAWLREPLYPRKIVGLICGFAGVAVVSLQSLNGHTSVVGVVLAILSGITWAIGTVYSKRVQSRVPMMWLVALQFLFGGAVMLIVGSLTESWARIEWTGTYWLSLVYLTAIGVALSWIVWFSLVQRGEVSRVSSYVFCVPILSVVIGVLFLHESFTPYLMVGLVFVTLGIYLVNSRTRGHSARLAPADQSMAHEG